MEYMPGGDFLGLLIRENILTEPVARFYMAEMIVCVEEAHALRCIHRDIKPDNFLVSASGHLKISDFGLAFDGHWAHDTSYYSAARYSLIQKLHLDVQGDEQDKQDATSLSHRAKWSSNIMMSLDKHEKKNLRDGEPLLQWRNRCGMRTSAKSVVGTSQYMAPEVVQGSVYDGRCDWWSIGVILYECLYGHTPFMAEEGRHETKQNILNHRATFILPPRPQVTSRCQHLIASLIQDKDTRLCSRRYQFKDMQQNSHPPSSNSARMYRDFAGRFVFPYDAEDIKAHRWFKGVPWDRLHELGPPFVPAIRSKEDTQYFDEEEPITDWSESESESDSGDDEVSSPLPELEVVSTPIKMQAGGDGPVASVENITNISEIMVPDHESSIITSFSFMPPSPPDSNPPSSPPKYATPNNNANANANDPPTPPQSNRKKGKREAGLVEALRPFSPSIQDVVRQWLDTPYDSVRLRDMEGRIDAEPGLRSYDRDALKTVVRVFGKKERKRPRDRLLRDKKTKKVVLEERKKTAFLGYTWRRLGTGMPVGEGMTGAAEMGGVGGNGYLFAGVGSGAEYDAAVKALHRARLSMH